MNDHKDRNGQGRGNPGSFQRDAKGAGVKGSIWRVRGLLAVALGFAGLMFSSCQQMQQQSVSAGGRYHYRYEPGKTARLQGKYAVAPKSAPREVHRAIAAANRLVNKPYRMGGGHRRQEDTAYDCSGSASYVLRNAGLLKGTLTSRSFARYGDRGKGDWINVYHRNGHVFLVIAGLRFDTGTRRYGEEGPRWRVEPRSLNGFYVRHPEDC